MLHGIGRHAPGGAGALAAIALLAAVLGVLSLVLLSALEASTRTVLVQAVDEGLLRWFEARRTPGLDRIMKQVTRLGDGIVVSLLALVVGRFLWLARRRAAAMVLVVAVLGGNVMNSLLKMLFARARPDIIEAVTETSSLAFPSGHAMGAFVGYASLAWALGRLGPPARRHRVTNVVAAAFILLIGTSRVYLGVHFPSDVVGGYLAGLVWLALVAAAAASLRFFAAGPPSRRDPA